MRILDIRSREQYDAEHVPGAVHLQMKSLADNILKIVPQKDSMLLIYGNSSEEALEACEVLKKLGYSQVFIQNALPRK